MGHYFSHIRLLHKNCLETSDHLIQFHPDSLQRRPIDQENIIRIFDQTADPWALEILSKIPHHSGLLENDSIDQLFLRTHLRFQNLLKFFFHGQRMLKLLCRLIPALPATASSRKIKIVDIGCGLGYMPRWLFRCGNLGANIQHIGVDINPVLIEQAQRLANQEKADCSFYQANAFDLEFEATLYTSTGLLHHFQRQELERFFSKIEESGAEGFIHFDFQPCRPVFWGSVLLHGIYMREEFARHDGLVSVLRAHSGSTLLKVAKQFAPSFEVSLQNQNLWGLPIPRAFHALCGLRKK